MPRLDEQAYETQAPLDNDWSDVDSSNASTSSSTMDDEGPFIMEGDIVACASCPAVQAMMLDIDQLVVGDDIADHEGVIGWFALSTYCGDPALKFQPVNLDRVVCVDRGFEPNDLVVSASNRRKKGVVLEVSHSVRGYRLNHVLQYHARYRYSDAQQDLAARLQYPSNLQKALSFSGDMKSVTAMAAHQRSLSHMKEVTVNSKQFLRSNPYVHGTCVRSRMPLSQLWAEFEDQDAIHDEAKPFLQKEKDGEGCFVERHYVGHITGVWHTVLVELFLPGNRKGSAAKNSSAGVSYSPKYLVLIQPKSIREGTVLQYFDDKLVSNPTNNMEGSNSERSSPSMEEESSTASSASSSSNENLSAARGNTRLQFRHLNNMIAFDMEGYHDGSVSLAPPNFDTIAPLMYAEDIDLDLLEKEVIWIQGSFEEYESELAAWKQVEPKDLCRDEIFGNGIVVFAFPEQVTLDPPPPHTIRLIDLEPIVTTGQEVACELFGCCGFVVSSEELSPPAATSVGPNVIAGTPLIASNAIRDWYERAGVLKTAEDRQLIEQGEEECMWRNRVQRLYPHVHQLIVVHGTSSSASVAWQEGRSFANVGAHGETVESPMLEPIDRDTLDDHDFYPMDMVVPAPSYPMSSPHDLPPTGLLDEKCPLLDLFPLYEFDTEMMLGEPVRLAHRKDDVFYVQGNAVEDPPVIGMIERLHIKERCCQVRWFSQPSGDALRALRRSLFEAHINDVGVIVAIEPDTTLRVMWQDGSMDKLPRCLVMPCRPAEVEEDGDEDQNTNDEEDPATSTVHPSFDVVGSHEESHEGDVNVSAADDDERSAQQPTEGAPPPAGLSALGILKYTMRGIGMLANALVRQPAQLGDEWIASPPTESAQPASPPITAADSHDEGEAASSSSSPATGNEEGVSATKTQAGGEPATTLPLIARSSFSEASTFASHKWKEESDQFRPLNPLVFNRRVQREWRDMRDQLSSGPLHSSEFGQIYVKVSSEELRLLKFVLVGPLHTPYYQSFLAFDLAFVEDFPMRPPKVSFHAEGIRLNPNLYADGHICLSLLGTWSGEGASESWNMVHSTVMQILLSIQSLVLVKEPYYNEAGFDEKVGTTEGRAASAQYNENLALSRIAHLCKQAEKPPADWVYEFRAHFRAVVPRMVQRLRAAIAADKAADGSITADGLVLPMSSGFLISMSRSLTTLENTYQRLTTKWDEEEAEYSLAHMDL